MISISQSNEGKQVIAVDNVIITKEIGYVSDSKKDIWVSINDAVISQLATEETFKGIPNKITRLSLNLDVEAPELVDEIEVRRLKESNNRIDLAYVFKFDFENWKRPWSIVEYAEEMMKLTVARKEEGINWEAEDEDSISNGFSLFFQVINIDNTIGDEIQSNIHYVWEIHDRAIVSLIARSRQDSIISFFDFPESVRIPCEQYLLYFVNFLRDIGINASADIEHEAGRVLFSVTPENDSFALEQIHYALELFLQLPAIPVMTGYSYIPKDMRVQQLMANIQHLNGQLMLASAIVNAKNETICIQQDMISQQKELIDGRIMQESLRYITDGKVLKDKESFLGGAVLLTPITGKGFEIDLPKIFRTIKNLISKN